MSMCHLLAVPAQLVEDMCLHKMADRLYANLQKECDSHIGGQLSRLAAEQTMDPVLFLSKARCSSLSASFFQWQRFGGLRCPCSKPAGDPARTSEPTDSCRRHVSACAPALAAPLPSSPTALSSPCRGVRRCGRGREHRGVTAMRVRRWRPAGKTTATRC